MANTPFRPSTLAGDISQGTTGRDSRSNDFLVSLLLMLLLVSYFIITRFRTWRRLSAFPGPALSSISYWPMLLTRLSGSAHLDYATLSQRYGPLTRIGPNDLLSSDAEHLRRMSAARSTYERSSWYRATRLDPYHDMMGSVMDKALHTARRTTLLAGYTGKDNPRLEADMDAQVHALVRLIQRKYVTPGTHSPSSSTAQGAQAVPPVDLGTLADLYAHDYKASLAFGRPLGMLAQGRDVHGIVAISKLALKWIQVFTDIPPLQRIFLSDTVLRLMGPKPTDSFGVGKLMGMARDLVAARFSPGAEDQQDMLGSFLRHGLDRRSAESEAMFPIIAGSDTTATAIKMVLSYIASCPRASRRLQAEIHDAVATGRLSSPATHAETTKHLPYLQAAIWEGLRMHPPFTGLIMKEVGPEGDRVHGRFLPPGTRVGHSTWAIMRDTAVFGADVDTFRPERWLAAEEKARQAMQRQTELVFGSGRWGCPGRAVGLMEVGKVVVELFRRFDFHVIKEDEMNHPMVHTGARGTGNT